MAVCMAGALGWAQQAQAAEFSYSITFDDPLGLGATYYNDIHSHIGLALDQWAVHLVGSADYNVHVLIDDSVERATGRSLTSGFFLNFGGYDVYEQGMAYKLRTGIDSNGSLPDIEIVLNPYYLADELWFDPTPADTLEAVDPNRIDATSVFVHEIGHALGFNGWGDALTGEHAPGYASTWDVWVRPDEEGHLYFHGPLAMSVYGGPVPITNGANFHLGNAAGPGVDLINDVMGGVYFARGHRYEITGLDLAMLKDMGIAVQPGSIVDVRPLPMPPSPTAPVPEPETVALTLAGLLAVAAAGRLRAGAARSQGACAQA